MALSENALVTFDDVQAQLTYVEDSDETAVNALIESASIRANAFTGRKLMSRELTEYYNGNGLSTLKLNQFPVTDFTGLYVDSSRAFGDGTLYTEDTDYTLDYDTGIITLFSGVFPVGVKKVKAVYTAGFETVPDDLKQAVIEMIAQALDKYRGHGVGLKSVTSSAGMNTTYETGIPYTAMQVLSSYKDWRF